METEVGVGTALGTTVIVLGTVTLLALGLATSYLVKGALKTTNKKKKTK